MVKASRSNRLIELDVIESWQVKAIVDWTRDVYGQAKSNRTLTKVLGKKSHAAATELFQKFCMLV